MWPNLQFSAYLVTFTEEIRNVVPVYINSLKYEIICLVRTQNFPKELTFLTPWYQTSKGKKFKFFEYSAQALN